MKNYVRKEIDEYGSIYFYNNKGQYHRIDGPAIEQKNGYKQWYIHGKCYLEEDFLYITKYKEIYKFNL